MIAEDVGFPLLVRPSYVLGGRAMEICYSPEGLGEYLERHVKADQEHPLLLDRFLEDAIEVDVDALCDGETCEVAGIMQHVEEAGVHSGDSACVIPPMSLGEEMLAEIEETTRRIALELGVIGLINIQYAVAGGRLYVIEANPRASRTVPFVSKAIGAPLAKIACRLMLGEPLSEIELPTMHNGHVSVKEAVLPFARFAGADAVLGPEMKSTGEVMGIAADFPTAFGKAQAAAGVSLPESGTVFFSVTDTDKAAATGLALRLHDAGFRIIATRGTAQAIRRMGIPVEAINKIAEGSPHVVDYIRNGEVDMVINTPTGSGARSDGYEIRSAAVSARDPLHHHDDRRDGGLAGDRRRARRGAPSRSRSRSCTGRRGARGRGEVVTERVRAPRAAALRGGRERGERRLPDRLGARLRGAGAGRGPVLHARRGRLGRPGRPPLPAASLLGRRRRAGRRRRPARLPARGGRARDRAAGGAAPGRRAAGHRAARATVLGPGGARPGRPGAILVGGGIGIAPLAILRRRLAAAGVPQRVLLGFRDRAHAGGLELFDCSEVRTASEDGHTGHQGYVTDLLAVVLEGDDARRRRRLRLRAAGDAGGGAGAVRRARGARRAGDGGADGLRLRLLLRLRGAARRRRLHPALRRRAGGPRRRDRDGAGGGVGALSRDVLRDPARAPGAQRLGDLRRDRRPARVRRRRSTLSVQHVRLEDDHPRAPGGKPAAAPVRDPGRDDQLDRAAEQGARGLSGSDLPALAALPVPLCVSVMAPSREGFARLVEAVGARDEVAAIELNVSCPNVKSGLIVGEQPAETLALCEALRPLTAKPLIVKLTPNCADPAAVAAAAAEGGADAVSLINTLRATGPDPATLAPWLGAGSGGLSGPAIRAIALDQVRRVAAAVSIPVIGMGGIESGADAAALLAAGATAVAVGTANFRDPLAAERVRAELAGARARERRSGASVASTST